MSDGEKRIVQLPDGSYREISARQFEAITVLTDAISNVVRGDTLNLAIVENDGGRYSQKSFFSLTEDAAGLNSVADALFWLSKLSRQISASWDGNVRGDARSYLEH